MKANIGIEIDIARFIETRAMVVSNSGGGKSYLLRKIVEEMAGKVPIIILDIEGEFHTLREKFDFVLFGKDGDYPVTTNYADVLARNLLELNASAIIDLYELSPDDKKIFVRKFCDALIQAPKELWKPTVIVIDEAHIFVPEKGQAQSSSAVINLLTRGRKRGFCTVLATQRLSKLHKDAAAECLNKMIGRTSLDIDMKRASEELGFTNKQDFYSLRNLVPGEFFAFGPAISNAVEKFKVSPVKTTHPKAGMRAITPAPPSKHIKEVLGKLKDLPERAEKEIKTLQDLKKAYSDLEKENKRLLSVKPVVDEDLVNDLRKETNFYLAMAGHYNSALSKLKIAYQQFNSVLQPNLKSIDNILSELEAETIKKGFNLNNNGNITKITIMKKGMLPKSNIIGLNIYNKDLELRESIRLHKNDNKRRETISRPYIAPKHTSNTYKDEEEITKLGKAQIKILSFLLLQPNKGFSKQQVGAMTGYAHSSGSFNTYLSDLSAKDLIIRNGGGLKLNTAKEDIVRQMLDGVVNENDFKLSTWLEKLGKGPRAIFEYCLNNPNYEFTTQELAEVTGYKISGSFNTYLSKLSTLGLIDRTNGKTKLAEDVKEFEV